MEIRKLSIMLLVVTGIALALIVGREIGIRHAIEDSEIAITERGIEITLDGNLYEHDAEF